MAKTSHIEKLAFEYIGGLPAPDFVNTVSWFEDDSTAAREESFLAFDDVIRWAEGREVLTQAEARALRRLAKNDPRRAEQEFASALELRRTLRDLFSTLANGATPDASLLN